jgi:CheY-like chemotaxis protein
MAGVRPTDEDAGGAAPTEELGGLVVLVVDDEAVVRAYVARALTVAGMDVAVAADGREALRLVAEDRVRPKVVVTDIEMPAMTGVELAARLLAIRPSIRIVMMTGDPERAEAARRHPAIVDEVILKPMRIEVVVDAVRAAAAADLDVADRRRGAGALGVRSSGTARGADRGMAGDPPSRRATTPHTTPRTTPTEGTTHGTRDR